MTSLTQCEIAGLIEASRLRSTGGVCQLIERLADLPRAIRIVTWYVLKNHFRAVQLVSINYALWLSISPVSEPRNEGSTFHTY
jgi:hypothetical protein